MSSTSETPLASPQSNLTPVSSQPTSSQSSNQGRRYVRSFSCTALSSWPSLFFQTIPNICGSIPPFQSPQPQPQQQQTQPQQQVQQQQQQQTQSQQQPQINLLPSSSSTFPPTSSPTIPCSLPSFSVSFPQHQTEIDDQPGRIRSSSGSTTTTTTTTIKMKQTISRHGSPEPFSQNHQSSSSSSTTFSFPPSSSPSGSPTMQGCDSFSFQQPRPDSNVKRSASTSSLLSSCSSWPSQAGMDDMRIPVSISRSTSAEITQTVTLQRKTTISNVGSPIPSHPQLPPSSSSSSSSSFSAETTMYLPMPVRPSLKSQGQVKNELDGILNAANEIDNLTNEYTRLQDASQLVGTIVSYDDCTQLNAELSGWQKLEEKLLNLNKQADFWFRSVDLCTHPDNINCVDLMRDRYKNLTIRVDGIRIWIARDLAKNRTNQAAVLKKLKQLEIEQQNRDLLMSTNGGYTQSQSQSQQQLHQSQSQSQQQQLPQSQSQLQQQLPQSQSQHQPTTHVVQAHTKDHSVVVMQTKE